MALEIACKTRGHHAKALVVELSKPLQQLECEDAAAVRSLQELIESLLEHRRQIHFFFVVVVVHGKPVLQELDAERLTRCSSLHEFRVESLELLDHHCSH